MPNQYDRFAFAAVSTHFCVHFGNQWAGRIQHPEFAVSSLVLNNPCYTMRTEYDRTAIRNRFKLIDEDCAFLL